VWLPSRQKYHGHDLLSQTDTREGREQHHNLYMVLIDLTKAFDSVNEQGLWLILHNIGCPGKFINIIRSFHEGMKGQVS